MARFPACGATANPAASPLASTQTVTIDALTAGLQKVSAQLALSKSAPRTVENSQWEARRMKDCRWQSQQTWMELGLRFSDWMPMGERSGSPTHIAETTENRRKF